MARTLKELRTRFKTIEDTPENAFPVGSYVYVVGATGSAANTIYRVEKHEEPGKIRFRTKTNWSRSYKDPKTGRTRYKTTKTPVAGSPIWRTQVKPLVLLSPVPNRAARDRGRTTYDSCRLMRIDIVDLCKLRTLIDQLVSDVVESCTGAADGNEAQEEATGTE
jgi:hypothetical protein